MISYLIYFFISLVSYLVIHSFIHSSTPNAMAAARLVTYFFLFLFIFFFFFSFSFFLYSFGGTTSYVFLSFFIHFLFFLFFSFFLYSFGGTTSYVFLSFFIHLVGYLVIHSFIHLPQTRWRRHDWPQLPVPFSCALPGAS